MTRRTRSRWVVLLLARVPQPVCGAEASFVADPSFEAPSTLDAWRVQRPAGTTVAIDPTMARTGKSSIEIQTSSGREQESFLLLTDAGE